MYVTEKEYKTETLLFLSLLLFQDRKNTHLQHFKNMRKNISSQINRTMHKDCKNSEEKSMWVKLGLFL